MFRRRLQLPLDMPAVIINSVEIERVSQYRFLGVLLDENLNFNKHIQFVISKVSKFVFIFYNIRSFLDSKTLLLIYYTLVYPNVIYNITVWGGAAATRLNPLNVCLNKVIRTIKFANRRASATPLYVSLELLNLRYIYKYAVGNYTFKSIKNSIHPSTMSFRSFTYNTRASELQLLEVPLALSSHSEQSLSIAGPVIYNRIPLEIRRCDSYDSFKYNFKKHLKSLMSGSV